MKSLSWRTLATGFLLLATITAVYAAGQREPEKLNRPLSELPEQVGGWSVQTEEKLSEETEAVLRASDYLVRTYRDNERWLEMFVAFYAMQQAGESMHSPRNCLPGSGWEIWNYDTKRIEVAGEQVPINKYWVQKDGRRILVYYWYQTGDRVIANEYVAKACLVLDAVFKGRTSGSIVRLILPDVAWADEAAMGFARETIPQVGRLLPSS